MMFGSKYPALEEQELEKPLIKYRSINELFTRDVPSHLRPIPDEDGNWLVPADGRIQDVGDVGDATELIVKGQKYSLSSLCPLSDTSVFIGGKFAVTFLSPRDCHRVFAPADGELTRVIHVPGHRLLVHPSHQREQYPVFSLNERQIMEFKTELGRCLIVMVAGWGVGNITHPFPLHRRFSGRRVTATELVNPKPLRRGEWLATFELGSTVILVVENKDGLSSLIHQDENVRFRQPAFRVGADCTAVEAAE